MDDKLTKEEWAVLDLLAQAWNRFLELPSLHDMDATEMCRDIHSAQNRVAARVARRQMARERQEEEKVTAADGSVGGLIRAARKKAGLGVSQLAGRLGLSRNTLTNWEAGRSEPTAGELVRLAKSLGVRPGSLLTTGGDDGRD